MAGFLTLCCCWGGIGGGSEGHWLQVRGLEKGETKAARLALQLVIDAGTPAQ